MIPRKLFIFLFFFSLIQFFGLINVVYAPQDVDITQVPQLVGESFGIPEPNTAIIGGAFMSCIVFLCLVMPTLLLRNKAPALIMSLMVLGFLALLNWLPVWLMLLIVVLIVSMFASKMKRVLS